MSKSFPTWPFLLAIFILLIAPIEAIWAEAYIYRILLAGPLLFVPWGMQLLKFWATPPDNYQRSFYFLAVALLLVSYCLPGGLLAAGLSLPWLGWVSVLAFKAWQVRGTEALAMKLAFSFLPVAAAWMVADRLAWQPLGFDPLVVLLTGIHFHYAGFALAIVVALLPADRFKKWTSIGLLPGVAGVATGITVTQLAGPAWIEMLGVTTMVLVASGVAIRQIAYAINQRQLSSIALGTGGLALLAGMTLALLYGWRFEHQWPWLSMPFMYATHGVLNSLGFSLASFLAYTMLHQKEMSIS